MKLHRLATLLVLAGSLGVAHADRVTNKEAGLSLELPGGWVVEKPSSKVVIAHDPKDEASVLMVTVDAADTKKIGDAMDAQLAKTMTDITWGPQQKITVAGLSAISLDGTAKMEGQPFKLRVVIATTAKKKGVFVLHFVFADKEQAHKAELDGVMQSIKTVK